MKRRISTKSKWMIISSFVLSALLIATIAVNMAAYSWETDMVFVIGLIALAVAAFAGTVIMRLRRRGYAKRLSEEYFAEYEKVRDALGSSMMSRAEAKETLEDVLSLMLEAQAQGRGVKEVVGETDAFVRRLLDSFGYRNNFLFQMLSVVQYGIILTSLIQLLIYFEEGGRTGIFDIRIGVSMFVMLMIVVFVVYPVIRSGIRKDRSVLPFVLPLAFGVGYVALMEVLRSTAGHLEWVEAFLDGEMKMIFSWWLFACLLAVMLAAQGVKIFMRRRSLRRLGES
jgi:DNA-binding ferritin-like protein (Dps family)